MLKLFKDSAILTNEYIILATPLIFFLWLLGLYIAYAKSAVISLPLLLLSFITVSCMAAAFMSGWFYMVKKAFQLSKKVFVVDEDKSKAIFNLIKTIPSGIGKYFLSFWGMFLLFIFIVFCAFYLTYVIGINLIGKLDIDTNQLKGVLTSAVDLKTFLGSLSFEQLVKLNKWNLLFFSISSFTSFLLMLWIPEIIFKSKNSFVALYKSIYKIFLKPFNSIKIFLFISVLNILVSCLSVFAALNVFLYFITLVLYFYFLVYIVVLIFSYYDKEFS